MIYVTGLKGLIGQSLQERWSNKSFIPVDSRNSDFHWKKTELTPSLVHLGWKSIPTTSDTKKGREESQNDIANSIGLISEFLSMHPDGRVLFLSTAGDMYRKQVEDIANEYSPVKPRTNYGRAKLDVEEYIKKTCKHAIILRCANAWGGVVSRNRRNGFVDKLIYNSIHCITTTIYMNLDSVISLVHLSDISDSIMRGIEVLSQEAEMTEVINISTESKSLSSIIAIVSPLANSEIHYAGGPISIVKIDSTKATRMLAWKPRYYLNKENIRDIIDNYKR